MVPLPAWASDFFQHRLCPYCDSRQRAEWVCGVGIREIKKMGSKILETGNVGLVYEYFCPQCGRQSTTIVDPQDKDVSAIDLIKSLLKGILAMPDASGSEGSPGSSKSKITQEEFDDLKAKLASFTSHEEFLRFIGLPQDQIEKYGKPNANDAE
jgi:hypothetical protein